MTLGRAMLAVLAAIAGCGEREAAHVVDRTPEPAMPQASRPERARDRLGDVCILQARNAADVVARFKSTVAQLLVKLDDSVTKGQPVARLDDRPLKEDLTLARAALRARQAEVAQAEIERRAARAKLERERKAYASGIVAKEIVDDAEFNLSKAAAAVAAAVAGANEYKAKITIAEAHLADTTLVAPEAGRVALVYRQAGEPVGDGSAIVRVISNDELFVKLASPPDRKLVEGQQIELVVDQKLRVNAVVRRAAPNLDPVAQMIIGEADLVDPPAGLKAGMSCRFVLRSK